MRSIKVAGLTAASHLSKLLVALLIIKLIAMTAGPAGLGFLGNYMSLLSIASALAGGGVLTGVIKYLSEFSIDPQRQKFFVGNALIYSLGFSVAVVLVGGVFLKPITYYIFGGLEYAAYIVFFLFAQFIIALNNLAYGVLNGLQQNSRYAVIMVLGNLIAIVISYVLIVRFGTAGTVLAVTVPLLAPLLPMLFFSFGRRGLLQFESTLLLQDTVRLSRFSIMLIVSAICFPVVEIYIRSSIVATVGLDMSGIWQALIRLSSAYLGFYSVFLSFYLVPKISATEDKRIIFKTVSTIMLALSALVRLHASGGANNEGIYYQVCPFGVFFSSWRISGAANAG